MISPSQNEFVVVNEQRR